jgi:hypothetical protein
MVEQLRPLGPLALRERFHAWDQEVAHGHPDEANPPLASPDAAATKTEAAHV